MTPLWNRLDSAPANVVYAVIGIFLVLLAIAEYRWRP